VIGGARQHLGVVEKVLHGRKSEIYRSIYPSTPFFPLLGSLLEMYLQLHLCAGTVAARDVAFTALCAHVYLI
jgi:hypothetical protein